MRWDLLLPNLKEMGLFNNKKLFSPFYSSRAYFSFIIFLCSPILFIRVNLWCFFNKKGAFANISFENFHSLFEIFREIIQQTDNT